MFRELYGTRLKYSGGKEHGLVSAKEVVYMYSLVSDVLLLELRRFVDEAVWDSRLRSLNVA